MIIWNSNVCKRDEEKERRNNRKMLWNREQEIYRLRNKERQFLWDLKYWSAASWKQDPHAPSPLFHLEWVSHWIPAWCLFQNLSRSSVGAMLPSHLPSASFHPSEEGLPDLLWSSPSCRASFVNFWLADVCLVTHCCRLNKNRILVTLVRI